MCVYTIHYVQCIPCVHWKENIFGCTLLKCVQLMYVISLFLRRTQENCTGLPQFNHVQPMHMFKWNKSRGSFFFFSPNLCACGCECVHVWLLMCILCLTAWSDIAVLEQRTESPTMPYLSPSYISITITMKTLCSMYLCF